MRCPKCDAENPDGATECASCGAALAEPEGAAGAVSVEAPAPPKRRRISRLAILALLAACAAPWAQVARDQAGGPWATADPTKLYPLLWGLEILGLVLFLAAIAVGAISAVQVCLRRAELRGVALAIGGVLLGLGGMMGESLSGSLRPPVRDILTQMGGGAGVYNPQTTLIVAVAVIVLEIVLWLTGRARVQPQ